MTDNGTVAVQYTRMMLWRNLEEETEQSYYVISSVRVSVLKFGPETAEVRSKSAK